MSEELKDFLSLLFTKDPKERLGYNGAIEVKKHPWFARLDW